MLPQPPLFSQVFQFIKVLSQIIEFRNGRLDILFLVRYKTSKRSPALAVVRMERLKIDRPFLCRYD
jgi:hypothetical protein